MVNLIISKSRLLYSNTTQQLFDLGIEHITLHDAHFDDARQERFNAQSILGNE